MFPSFQLSEPHSVELPGLVSTMVWDSDAATPPAASNTIPLLLLHGWNIDAPTNFGYSFPHLSAQQRVIMFDQHGHGRGPRRNEAFTLEAAATDAVSVLDALEIDKVVVCGFSLGGAVAQTLLRDHPDRCAGLVLSATSGTFAESKRETGQFRLLSRTAKILRRSPEAVKERAFSALRGFCTRRYPGWIGDVVASADPVNLLEAGASLGTFNNDDWIGPIDVPSAFVVTSRDNVVPVRRQVDLATRLDVDSMHNVDAGHDVPIRDHQEFHSALVSAAATVTAAAMQTR